MKKWVVLVVAVALCLAFTNIIGGLVSEKPVYIPASPQRKGDAGRGYSYLTTGDYIKSGIPYSYFKLGFGKSTNNYLQREGLNKDVNYQYTAIKATNGEVVVAPNCLQCHAQVFDNKLYIGMGNTMIDFTSGQKLDPKNAVMAEQLLKNTDPKKYEAAEPFLRVVKAVGAQLYTQVRGVNSADRLASLLAAHRDPVTFRWSDSASMPVPDEVIPTDVPAWWLLKKKHAMFYNGFGRGDFGRFLMASNLLTVNDTAESREVDSHISDVLAYIYSLEPPKFPKTLNQKLVKQGSLLFVSKCASCHGNYGSGGEFPNLLIPESVIQTDSFLFKSNYQNTQFVNWFNNSWFAMGEHPARLEPFDGYVAQPLDGIWATAPYFHNGSVPDLEGVLNSRARPTYWSRDFDNPEYDYDNPGWRITVSESARGKDFYNTTLRGYGNQGHYFGDALTEKERKALIEYLKTL
jgi:mono/diheme cytochrome c family protein